MLVDFFSGKLVSSISVGSKHNLAICGSGEIFGWGCNKYGQLGIGDAKGALRPKPPKLINEKVL